MWSRSSRYRVLLLIQDMDMDMDTGAGAACGRDTRTSKDIRTWGLRAAGAEIGIFRHTVWQRTT